MRHTLAVGPDSHSLLEAMGMCIARDQLAYLILAAEKKI
jgi:hypothetical protein